MVIGRNQRWYRLHGISIALIIFAAGVGCVSKKRAAEQARKAYFQGQGRALMQREQAGPVVTVNGQVVRRRVDWREGLSLAEALLEAEYTGTTTPVSLRITRGGRPISVTMRRFLSGSQNPILEPNDVIEVR